MTTAYHDVNSDERCLTTMRNTFIAHDPLNILGPLHVIIIGEVLGISYLVRMQMYTVQPQEPANG